MADATLLGHWLDNKGGAYTVDPMQILHDLPADSAYSKFVYSQEQKAQQATGFYDSGWRNKEITAQQSLNWYYSFHDVQLRVSSTEIDGIKDVRVQLWKRYAFGSAGDGRSDLHLPLVGGLYLPIAQQRLSDLHLAGMAQNYNVIGEYDYSYPA